MVTLVVKRSMFPSAHTTRVLHTGLLKMRWAWGQQREAKVYSWDVHFRLYNPFIHTQGHWQAIGPRCAPRRRWWVNPHQNLCSAPPWLWHGGDTTLPTPVLVTHLSDGVSYKTTHAFAVRIQHNLLFAGFGAGTAPRPGTCACGLCC